MTRTDTRLHKRTIDEEIEGILHPYQQADPQTRCIQDLQYLYQKEQILTRAQQRLHFTDQSEERTNAQTSQIKAAQDARYTLPPQPFIRHTPPTWTKIAATLAVAALVLGILFMQTRVGPARLSTTANPVGSTATATVEATASATSNILFSDPLSHDIHDFTIDNQHFFKDGAYHILNTGSNSVALIVDQTFPQTNITYSLTMQEVAAANNDQDATNTYGLILRYNQVTTSGKQIQTFYTFEIRNQTGSSQYDFYKYDSSQGSPWDQLWHADTGNEFHGGHGSNAINMVKVAINGNAFTFSVNGKQVGTTQDTSYASGKMGMLVNLKGTEIAFTNMLITQP